MPEKSPNRPPSLHSKYNPRAEASRYLDAVSLPKNPKFIAVTEPGESFLADELRKRFPQAKICAVRYQDDFFRDGDALWDFCWRPGNGIPLEKFLFDRIPEEAVPATVFLPWKASESVWQAEAESAWQAIAATLRLQQKVMRTRAVFGRRWLKNIVRNATETENLVPCPEITKPPLIVASGPQLEKIPAEAYGRLPALFFVCALSSASAFLTSRGIRPDLCIATDGGYWAGRLFRADKSVPTAFPLEAYVPFEVLHENPCVPLHYGGALESEIFSALGIRAEAAVRNGTVAGTAAVFFLRKTPSPVYAAGLDLKSGQGFSHARPHPLSPETAGQDSRFFPLESATAASGISASLSVYRDWFQNMEEKQASRFFRLQCGPEIQQDLGNIRSVPIQQILGGAHALRENSPPCAQTRPTQRPQHPRTPPSGTPSDFRPTRAERREKIAAWLFSVSEAIRGISPEDFESEKPAAELVKLYAFSDYIGILKNFAQGDDGAETRRQTLCESAARFMQDLGESIAGKTERI